MIKPERDYRTGRYTKKNIKTVVLAVAVALLAALMFLGWLSGSNTVSAVNVAHADTITSNEIATQMVGKKIETLKDDVVNAIMQCESAGRDGIIIFDSNEEASIGSLQFQRKTIMHYVHKFEGRTIDQAEAIKIAIDHAKAHDLAKRIMFEEKDGYANWYNCSVKTGAVVRIDIIKSLE